MSFAAGFLCREPLGQGRGRVAELIPPTSARAVCSRRHKVGSEPDALSHRCAEKANPTEDS
jgi:hypothetical protein